MLRKLAESDPPSVTYRKHRGVTLTPDGEAIALEMIRRHRLLELFLHETLGYDLDKVHQEAERLEHTISPELVHRIATVLGDPEHDPHGEPIPTQDLCGSDTPDR
jgi:DtxR family Mn-dependent transcriptional regulator